MPRGPDAPAVIHLAMTMERGFEFELEDQPGTLRSVTRSLASAGVDIGGICGVSAGNRAKGIVILDDADAGRRAMEDAGVAVSEVELIVVDVPHRPGGLDQVLERLEGEDVNLQGVCPMAEGARIAFAVDDVQRARGALGEMAPAGR